MNLIGTEGKKEIKKFLSDALPPIRKALRTLYPERELIFRDGLQRLNLLYIPFLEQDREKGKPKGRVFPLPHGEADFEWTFLKGELAGWDWNEIAKQYPTYKFPKREPPFPASCWPLDLPSPQRKFPAIRDKKFLFHTFIFHKTIPIACWLLFINDIPGILWRDIFIILFEHHLRLHRLFEIYEKTEENKKIRSGLISPEGGIPYLHALKNLILKSSFSSFSRREEISVALGRLIAAIQHDQYFKRKKYEVDLEEERKDLEFSWKKLEGPTRKYRKEASRYVQPLLRDLFDCLTEKLASILKKDPSNYIDKEPPPIWLRTDHRFMIGARVNEQHIYRLIGDLIRFFYDWYKLSKFGSVIEPPDWRGDQTPSRIPEEISKELAKHGELFRRQFGKRMQVIHE